MWTVGEGGFKLHLFGLSKIFHDWPKFAGILKDLRAMRNKNTLRALKSKSRGVRPLLDMSVPVLWIHIGCGLIRSLKTRQMREIKDILIGKGIISIITRHIHRRSLTLQFLEQKADLLVEIQLKYSLFDI
jgi:hypothetical protein